MYFFDLDSLCSDLESNSLSSPQIARYAFADLLLTGFFLNFPYAILDIPYSHFDWAVLVINLAFVVWGFNIAFKASAGSSYSFLDLFFPFSWVIGCRVALLWAALAGIFYLVMYSISESAADGVLGSLGGLAIQIFIEYKFWTQLRSCVARVSRA